jgi:hypothetical protein
MCCAKSCIENIYYVSGFWFTYSFIWVTYSNVKCFSADRQVSKVADTSNLSTHFRYRKVKFCVHFGIEIGIGSADTDLKSIGIGIELKILVSPITSRQSLISSRDCSRSIG